MENVIIELSKYAILFCFLLFTISGFAAIGKNRGRLFSVQRTFLFFVHFLGFLTLYIQTKELKYLVFYAVQAVFFAVMIGVYSSLYPKMSRLIINNMFMLLAVGFIMISRITFSKSVKQFVIAAAACVLSLFIPILIKKMKWLSRPVWLYAAAGIGFLGVMKLAGIITYGASISFTVFGITVQPVEFVKIIFVFFLASFLSKHHDFKSVILVSLIAAVHVLLLVWSKELGGALIFCVVYLALVYVATRQPLYFLGGLLGGSGAAVVAYHLFNHVRVRVLTWSTPFSKIKNDTSQISQSLFAIGTGNWFGMGLMEGMPDTIPVASEDMIFSAITEELGLFFSLCMILICLSTFIMFINIATKIKDPFYKLLATGFGIEYIFQVFLTIGGGTKFIPLTGVTLPLISYGGSSVLCSIIIFQVIQGIYVLKQTETGAALEYEEDYDDDPEYEDKYDSEDSEDDEYYGEHSEEKRYYDKGSGNNRYHEDLEDDEYDNENLEDAYYDGEIEDDRYYEEDIEDEYYDDDYDDRYHEDIEDEYYDDEIEDDDYDDKDLNHRYDTAEFEDQADDKARGRNEAFYHANQRRRSSYQKQYERYNGKQQKETFDEYAVTDDLKLDIPEEFFED
ncbi:MAG: FtsW/RodA/SpoVE family cell cycle protein [Lachnospiraceae bacterium]|nr:FtsW/RodA/SpoVE family cell cycle protein [Lachnospiraceae bacterium]